MLRYLRELSFARTVLWCYLSWYLGVLYRYFDSDPRLWLTSLGIGAIVGTALYLSTAHAGPSRTQLSRWQIVRLFMMPFCVSSFAALVKGRGFVLVFYPSLRDYVSAAFVCAALLALIFLVKRVGQRSGAVNALPRSARAADALQL